MTQGIRSRNKIYVVIYGAHNNGSRAFCKYLAQYGYSLILIDREEPMLTSMQKAITSEFPECSIMKIRMDEFDEGEALRVVKQVNKLGDSIKGLILTKNIMLSENNTKKFEELSYEEMHQMMHINNEIAVGITNVLLKSIKKAGDGFIINLRNTKHKSVRDMIFWDLLFYSTSQFSKNFISAIRESEPKLNVIDVKLNYSNIKKEDEKYKLCSKTFGYLGI